VRLETLVARGFRNLAALELPVPAEGVVLLGENGHGKTNLLEAAYYPVLFRSLRGAPDQEVASFAGGGFHVSARFESAGKPRAVEATWSPSPRKKRLALDGVETTRVMDAVGAWVAVAFLPDDVALAGGSAGVRRQYLDRLLSLADRDYLRSLAHYRAALAQRNSALRSGHRDLAAAFEAPLATAGAAIVSKRQRWVEAFAPVYASELAQLGEAGVASIRYRGHPELADAGAWRAAFAAAIERDVARGLTTVGPHRDDLVLELGGREVRAFGSTGQQRSAAIALKLLEIDTLAAARGEEPVLILDDVFAELDRPRQDALATRLLQPGARQVLLSAPRREELPPGLDLPVWAVARGRVTVPRVEEVEVAESRDADVKGPRPSTRSTPSTA
jgi:DNA replication and repair protein RecF